MAPHLFAHHSRATLAGWARRLALFRFVQVTGGHANDGDSLDVLFHAVSTEHLLALLSQLGLEPEVFDRPPQQPVVGAPYTADELAAFPSLIPQTRWIAQVGHCTLFGVPAFVWCHTRGEGFGVRISLGSGYEVTEEDVARAERLERALRALPFAPVDPPGRSPPAAFTRGGASDILG